MKILIYVLNLKNTSYIGHYIARESSVSRPFATSCRSTVRSTKPPHYLVYQKDEKMGVSETAVLSYTATGSLMPHSGVRGSAFILSTALQTGRLRPRFPMGYLGFFIEFIPPAAL
jgi:hypothetical protein